MVIEDVSFTLPVAGLTLPVVLLEESSEAPPLGAGPVLVVLAPLDPPSSELPLSFRNRDEEDRQLLLLSGFELFLMESQKLPVFMLDVAREGINRSEIPMSIEWAECLRRLDDEREVALECTELALLLPELASQWFGDNGKKNFLLQLFAAGERIGVGRNIVEESKSLGMPGGGMILSSPVVDAATGEFAFGVW